VNLLGLTVVQYAGLLAGAGALVVVFYLLKLRRRRVAVPFGKLWEQVLMDRQATSLLQRLRRILSLLLQLLLLWLLVTALADPREKENERRGRDIVVLVDTSASMRARDVARGDGRIGEARAWVRSAVGKLGPRDRMMIVQMDAQVMPLTPLVPDRLVLEKALSSLSASDTEADFARGLRLATDVLTKGREGHIVLLSDGVLGEARDAFGVVDLGGAELHWVKIGEGGRNVGLSSFSVRRYPIDRASCEIFVEVSNSGDQDERVELALLGDGQESLLRRLTVGQGQKVHLSLPGQEAATQTLEARVALVGDACASDRECPPGGHCAGDRRCIFPDDQPADDRAFALLPERRPIKVLAVSPGDLYLAAALLLDEYLDVTEMSPDEYEEWLAEPGASDAAYETVIFDGVAPPAPPLDRGRNLIYLGVEGDAPPLEASGEVTGGIWFDSTKSKRQHPLLRYVSFGDFEVYRAVKTAPRPGDEVIARSEDGVPLAVVREEEGRHVAMLTFPLRNSDLPLRMAWPVLLMNTLSWYAEQDAGFISSYQTGHPVHLRVPPPADGASGGETARVCGPDGCRDVAVHAGEAVFVPARAGFYQVTAGAARTVVAANSGSALESIIEPAESVAVGGRRAATRPPELHATVGGQIWLWLLMAAVAIVLLEWLTYHRRVTV
jgi:hypothetical protein